MIWVVVAVVVYALFLRGGAAAAAQPPMAAQQTVDDVQAAQGTTAPVIPPAPPTRAGGSAASNAGLQPGDVGFTFTADNVAALQAAGIGDDNITAAISQQRTINLSAAIQAATKAQKQFTSAPMIDPKMATPWSPASSMAKTAQGSGRIVVPGFTT